MSRKALFLDRDGVINEDKGFVHTPAQVEFIPGIFDLVRRANQLDYLVIVITNQSGIGRGLYSEQVFHALMDWISGRFDDVGAKLDGIYFCAEPPSKSPRRITTESCRKPNPSMLLLAKADFDIDLTASVLVGDRWSDVEAGLRAGVSNLFQLRGSELHPMAIPIEGLGQINLKADF